MMLAGSTSQRLPELADEQASNSLTSGPASADICRDHLAGKCTRPTCKFAHFHPGVPAQLPQFNTQSAPSGDVCRDFQKGRCFRASCRFYHPPGTGLPQQTFYDPLQLNPYATEQQVCFDYINAGYCKREHMGQVCRYRHLPPSHPEYIQHKRDHLGLEMYPFSDPNAAAAAWATFGPFLAMQAAATGIHPASLMFQPTHPAAAAMMLQPPAQDASESGAAAQPAAASASASTVPAYPFFAMPSPAAYMNGTVQRTPSGGVRYVQPPTVTVAPAADAPAPAAAAKSSSKQAKEVSAKAVLRVLSSDAGDSQATTTSSEEDSDSEEEEAPALAVVPDRSVASVAAAAKKQAQQAQQMDGRVTHQNAARDAVLPPAGSPVGRKTGAASPRPVVGDRGKRRSGEVASLNPPAVVSEDGGDSEEDTSSAPEEQENRLRVPSKKPTTTAKAGGKANASTRSGKVEKVEELTEGLANAAIGQRA